MASRSPKPISEQHRFDDANGLLILAMVAPLANRIKMSLGSPRKNIELARDQGFLAAVVTLLLEQILPQWCERNQ